MAQNDTLRKKPKDTKGTMLRLLSYIGLYKWALLVILCFCIASNILSLLGPGYAGKAINEAAKGAGKVNFDNVRYYAIRMLVAYLLSSLMTIAINILMTRVSRKIAEKLRQDVFDKLLKLPVGFFDRNQAGDIISRVSYDIDVISTCIATDVTQIMSSLVTVIGSLIMMLVVAVVSYGKSKKNNH